MSPTGAGLAVKMYKQVFLEEELFNSPASQIPKEQSSYKGGRTEAFIKLFRSNERFRYLNYIDINSSYPFAMTMIMPKTFLRCVKMDEEKRDNFTDHWLYLAKSKYIGNHERPIPNLLIRKNDCIIAVAETDYAYHWGCELNEAVKNEFEIKIIEVNMYEGATLFKTFAEYMYGQRLQYKKTNKAKAEFLKLCMNSLYGKFGQKKMVNVDICTSKLDMLRIFGNKDFKVVDWDILSDDRVVLKYNKPEDDFAIGTLVRFSSCIAAYARCNLSKMMRSLGWEHVYYCDTDSIFTDVEPPAELVSQTELGKWKKETDEEGNILKIVSASFLAPKCYNYRTDLGKICMKAKGQPATELKEEYFDDLASGKKKHIEVLNPAMFIRSMNEVSIIKQERTITPVMNKRIWDGITSKPFKNIEEWSDNKEVEKSEKRNDPEIREKIKKRLEEAKKKKNAKK